MNNLINKTFAMCCLLGLVISQSSVLAQNEAMGGMGGAATVTDLTFDLSEVQAGEYVLEHDHGRVHWSVSHHGFSMFTAVFPLIDASLDFHPDDISKSQLKVTVDMTAVDSSIDAFDERLNGEAWFNTAKYPTAVFTATDIVTTGENTLSVTGDLTFMGQTNPLTMDVGFIKAANVSRPPGGYRVGFDATATMIRSEWGMPKSTVGDEVSLKIEAEFIRPGSE